MCKPRQLISGNVDDMGGGVEVARTVGIGLLSSPPCVKLSAWPWTSRGRERERAHTGKIHGGAREAVEHGGVNGSASTGSGQASEDSSKRVRSVTVSGRVTRVVDTWDRKGLDCACRLHCAQKLVGSDQTKGEAGP